MANLRSELKTVQYDRKENDLYSLNQTPDLSNFDASKFPTLTKFRKRVCLFLVSDDCGCRYKIHFSKIFCIFDGSLLISAFVLLFFRDLFKTDVLHWLRNVSGVDLNGEVAITSSKYNYTDLLLPHDDQCEGRKFAFTLYLTPDWKETDGGQLLLYDCDGKIILLLKFHVLEL